MNGTISQKLLSNKNWCIENEGIRVEVTLYAEKLHLSVLIYIYTCNICLDYCFLAIKEICIDYLCFTKLKVCLNFDEME